MNEKTKAYLESLAKRRPDLLDSKEVERVFRGLPADSEFGELKPVLGGVRLEMAVRCPPLAAVQELRIRLLAVDGISARDRKLLRMIRDRWDVIWRKAELAWQEEYKRREIHPEDKDWVLEAEIPRFRWWRRLFGGRRTWSLGVSAIAGARVLSLQMSDTSVRSRELI